MNRTYTITITPEQKSRLMVLLALENKRLDESKTLFDRPGDEAEYEKISQDMAKNNELYHLLATAKQRVQP